jgi:pimeloyl-ACP methyl ester carboxylesterase
MQRYVTDDGIEIAYEQWNVSALGTPVVLHHGYAAERSMNWVAPGIVKALVEAGKRVIALDARGHGQSAKPHDPSRYGESRMARDVIGLVDTLEVESYDLVGYSMGTVVALLVTLMDARVRRLVIGGIGASVVEQGGVDMSLLPPEGLALALEADELPPEAGDGARMMRSFVDAVGGDRLALAAQARGMHRDPIAVEAIKVPTLVLAGEKDDLAARPERLAQAIAGARLELLPTDHLSTVGHRRYRQALLEFLS